MKHDPTDDKCVRHEGGEAIGHCWTCRSYDNALWLTQRERFEAEHGIG